MKTQIYKLKNGAEVKGTIDQILSMAKAVGETVDLSKIDISSSEGYYKSSTHGLMKLEDMNDMHIRNALIKRSKEYYETLRKKKVPNDKFMEEYIVLHDDNTVVDLIAELTKRKGE